MPPVPIHNCSNTEPHEYHGYQEEMELVCFGITLCGENVHESHNIKRNTSVWCRGVCDCGDSMRGPHGPGDHK